MKPWMRAVGGLGLSIDVVFHWSDAQNPGSPGSVLRTLFVDADPGSPWWLIALGVTAHVMFFGVFAIMLISKTAEAPEKPREITPSPPPSSTATPGLARSPATPKNLERQLQEHLAALGPIPRAELLHVMTLPDYERAERIGGYYGDRRTRTIAQLLIELDGSPDVRAVVHGEPTERKLRGTSA